MMCFYNPCSINQYDLCDDWHATRSTAEGRRVGGRPPRFRLFHVPCRRASWGVEQTKPPTADITMLSCCLEKITLGNDKIHVMMCFYNPCSINQYDLCDDWHATRSTAEGRRVGGRPPRFRLFHVPCRRASWDVEQTKPPTADITMLSCCSEKITLGNDKIHVMMCFYNPCSINQYDLCDDWHATRSTAEGRRVGGRPPRFRLFHVPCRRASWGVEQTKPPTADITMLSCCLEKITLGNDKIHVMMCFFNLCSINQYDFCDDCHATRSTAEGRRVGGRPPRLRLFHVPCRRAS